MSDNTQEEAPMADVGTTLPKYTAPVRVRAILDELDRAAAEYVETHKTLQAARVHFTAARERFASVKRIASDILSFADRYDWDERHGNVRYAAMTIGEAVREVLRDRAFAAAGQAIHSDSDPAARFSPGMTLEQIVDALETGNFEFKGAPRRETNAALIRLDGVTKDEETDEYAIEDAGEILQMFVAEHAPAAPEHDDARGKEGSATPV
jgi:hypothetical protein